MHLYFYGIAFAEGGNRTNLLYQYMHSITARIKEFNKDRIHDTLSYKYKIMTGNMFSFYRGTCHIFYEDLHKAGTKLTSPRSWICGDLHLENFGSYKGSNRLVYFDLNDFDEGVLAPASLELVRMITSIFIAFVSLKIEQKKASNMARLFLKTYADTLAKGKAHYIEPQTAKGIVCTFLTKASNRRKKDLFKKKTEKKESELSILMNTPKHRKIDKSLKRELVHHITSWIMYNNDSPYNYEVVDAAFRLAGTSSLGLKRYVLLLKNINEPKKYLLLEMKQAKSSCLQQYNLPQPAWSSDAERIVAIQQRMQNVPPALASTTVFKNEAYVVQEMQPTKDSIDFQVLKNRYRDMCKVIDDMALLTASSQLRSSGRQGSATADELIAFGKNTDWQEAVIDYAINYLEKIKRDYKNFKEDYKIGLLNKPYACKKSEVAL